jgi:hypothetical protein
VSIKDLVVSTEHARRLKRNYKLKRGRVQGPISIDDASWLYAQNDGLWVVQEVRRKDGSYVATAQTRIPWKLLSSLTIVS